MTLRLLLSALDPLRCRSKRKADDERCVRSAWHRIWPRDNHRYRRREKANGA